MAQISLERLVQEVKAIPALPTTVTRALKIIDDPEAGPKDLAMVLSEDQSLTATVLKYANSAYYGVARKISTVSDAIVVLGFATIRSLIIAASINKTVNKEIPGYALAKGELWKHSIFTAMIAKTVARKARSPKIEQAFVAGLIHDIGKVVLNAYVAEVYQDILKRVDEDMIPFCVAEKELIGYDHAEVGAYVAKSWNFPADLVDAIEHHHHPLTSEKPNHLTAIVHVADAIALMLGLGLGADGLAYGFDDRVLKFLKITPDDVEQIIAQVSEMEMFNL